MTTVRVLRKESGKAAKSVGVRVAFSGLISCVSGIEYTDRNGDAFFEAKPGYGKVFVNELKVHEGILNGQVVVYISDDQACERRVNMLETTETDIYEGIEGKILVYHSPWYHKSAYFYRIVRQTPKTVVVEKMREKTVHIYEIGGYEDVVPDEEKPCCKPRRMRKTFKLPSLVKGKVEDGMNYLELWDGKPCKEDPMY